MIIDACIAFNELDIYELRVNELHDVVDHFVLVESQGCFGSTNKKQLYFKELLKDKPNFTYIELSDLEPSYTDGASGWQREKYQRDAIMLGIEKISTSLEDIVIASDTDEIPRPSTILETIPKLNRGIHRLNLDFFYYNVNCSLGHWPWGTTIGTVQQYKAVGGIHQARSMNYHDDNRVINDAGWHLSYFGGLDRIRTKVESFSHSTDDFCQAFLKRTDEEALKDITSRQDIYRTRGLNQFDHRDENDPKLPKTFLNNKERYKHFIA